MKKHNYISRSFSALAVSLALAGPVSAAERNVPSAYATIQAAIDAALPNDTINVYPGAYDETASSRSVLGVGSYQFGLFISKARNGITVQGVDANGKVITDFSKVLATVTTNATNNFGPSGIFIEGDRVTISGLRIGTNAAGQNKTIEIIGDDFTLMNCDIADLQGSIYLNDWQFDVGTNTSYLRSYRIEGNLFQDGVSLDLADGAGFSGAIKDRVIRKNTFLNSYYWPSISFNGSNTGVPWFVYSVGGAIIRSNEFINTFAGDSDPLSLKKEGHIRARGTYDNSQFDWDNYFNENQFNHAFVVGPKPPKELRTYFYTSGTFTFNNVRRIGAIKAAEQANAQPGDKVLSKNP